MTEPDAPIQPVRSKWDERYAGDEYAFGTEPNDFLARIAERIPPGPVLCLAEGEGRNAVHLAERGHPVTAVDASGEGIRKTRRLAAERGVEVEAIQADLASWDMGENRWAGIVAIFAHFAPSVRPDIHRRAARALAPGGVLVLEAYRPEQIDMGTGGPPDPQRLMTAEMLREDFGGLRFELLEAKRREVLEGCWHTGLGEVIQLVARKP